MLSRGRVVGRSDFSRRTGPYRVQFERARDEALVSESDTFAGVSWEVPMGTFVGILRSKMNCSKPSSASHIRVNSLLENATDMTCRILC